MGIGMRFALLGHNIGYSLSSEVFSRIFSYAGQSGIFDTVDIPASELASGIDTLRGYDGFSVTVPYKEAILSYLKEVSQEATAIGAVNSVRVEGNELAGYNTDWRGFLYPLGTEIQAEDSFLVLGNGGAARAIVWALERNYPKSHITIAGRSMEKLKQFGQSLAPKKTDTVLWEKLTEVKASIIINCTPVGGVGSPDESPLPEDYVNSDCRLAYDLIYRPTETRFLSHMKSFGCQVINGLPMLVRQAIESYAIWNGETVAVDDLFDHIMKDLELSGLGV